MSIIVVAIIIIPTVILALSIDTAVTVSDRVD